MSSSSVKIIVIGGSAGCIGDLLTLISTLPQSFMIPVVVVLHRLKNVVSEMDKLLSAHASGKLVTEPLDKEYITAGSIYLAPQNYHLLIENDFTFSLDYSEAIQYSRPSIDVTFKSVAQIYGTSAVVILLSGANSDGSAGITSILRNGGVAIIQDTASAEYSMMPRHAAIQNPQAKVLSPDEIKNYLQALSL